MARPITRTLLKSVIVLSVIGIAGCKHSSNQLMESSLGKELINIATSAIAPSRSQPTITTYRTNRIPSYNTVAPSRPAPNQETLPPSQMTSDLAIELDKIITADSRSWMVKRYHQGSVRNARILEKSKDGKSSIALAYGEFSYLDGNQGWIKAKMVDGKVSCIEYPDFEGTCRSIGNSPSRGIAAGMLIGAMMGGGSGGGDSSEPSTAMDALDAHLRHERR